MKMILPRFNVANVSNIMPVLNVMTSCVTISLFPWQLQTASQLYAVSAKVF
nr:hypothetical protein [Snodgrassella alvi]